MSRPSSRREFHSACLRLDLDIWHPDCWTLDVTERTDGGLLGHGVYEVDELAVGRFTAFGTTVEVVDELVAAVDDSPLTDYVREVPTRRRLLSSEDYVEASTPGKATRGLLVGYEHTRSIADPLVTRGFIPDAAVRIRNGRERWTVVTDASRDAIGSLLDDVRTEADAEIDVLRIATPDVATGTLFPNDPLSDRQRQLFELARERGYYRYPRAVSATDIAEEVGLSKATTLEHLRKAESKLLDPRG